MSSKAQINAVMALFNRLLDKRPCKIGIVIQMVDLPHHVISREQPLQEVIELREPAMYNVG
jgi:hypothetical protein